MDNILTTPKFNPQGRHWDLARRYVHNCLRKKGNHKAYQYYYLEKLDCRNAYGYDMKLLFDLWKNNSTSRSFWDWINSDACKALCLKKKIKPYDEISSVRMNLNPRDFQAIGINGFLLKQTRSFENNKDILCFVFKDESGFFLALTPKIRGEIHHSSFESKKIRAMGMIQFSDGKLSSISNRSGHYVTHYQDLLLILKLFEKEEISINSAIIKCYFQYPKLHHSEKNQVYVEYKTPSNLFDFFDQVMRDGLVGKFKSKSLNNLNKSNFNSLIIIF